MLLLLLFFLFGTLLECFSTHCTHTRFALSWFALSWVVVSHTIIVHVPCTLSLYVSASRVHAPPPLVTGELRGQVVPSDMWDWDYSGGLYVELSGGSLVPPTQSTASGRGRVLLSTDGALAMAFLSLAGESIVPVLHACVELRAV